MPIVNGGIVKINNVKLREVSKRPPAPQFHGSDDSGCGGGRGGVGIK